jgi:hypothetical protein
MAFLTSSRYAKIDTVQATAAGGRMVTAVKLRRLPRTDGAPQVVQSNDRLDIIAFQQLGDATRFWRIADANSELEAEKLTATPGEILLVPTT